jgi:phosphate transport system substrate-binding protein
MAAPLAARADDIKIAGSGAALGTMRLLAEAYGKQQPAASISVLPSVGSSGGIKAVLAGAVQLAVSTRPLNDTEAKSGAVAFEYGRTPFVFAVPSAAKVSAVTTQNLADIYAGRMDQWPDGSRVRLVLRPVGDSDTETIKAISSAMREAMVAAEQRKGMMFTVTDQETADAVEKTPGGLGPSTLALLASEKRALKALVLDGVVPDAQNLASGRYPLVKQLFLVTGPKSPSAALAFLNFVKSRAGRQVLEANGHWVP